MIPIFPLCRGLESFLFTVPVCTRCGAPAKQGWLLNFHTWKKQVSNMNIYIEVLYEFLFFWLKGKSVFLGHYISRPFYAICQREHPSSYTYTCTFILKHNSSKGPRPSTEISTLFHSVVSLKSKTISFPETLSIEINWTLQRNYIVKPWSKSES